MVRAHALQTSNKNFILSIGMEKEQKQELGWRVSVLPIPAFHHCETLCVVYPGEKDRVITRSEW